jgi:hypothetical protein
LAATTPTVSPVATGSPTPTGPTIIHVDARDPLDDGFPLLRAGTSYRWNSFRPILVFRIDPGWTDRSWYPVIATSDFTQLVVARVGVSAAYEDVAKIWPGLAFLSFARVQTVVGNPCDPGDTSSYQLVGGRPSDMMSWLSGHRFLAASNLQPVELAGFSGLSVDVTVKGDPGMECAGLEVPHQGSVSLLKTTTTPGMYGGIYKIYDGEQARFVALDIGGDEPLLFITKSLVTDFPSRSPWAQDLVNTITVTDAQ